MKYLANALKKNRKLTKLDVSSNKITDIGANHLADILRSNKTLRDVNVGHNLIKDSGFDAISTAREVNDTLDVLAVNNNKLSLRYRIKSEKIQVQKTLKRGKKFEGMTM
mmetsp:Transcript_15103/g.18674  ORF Transcript_15103/g.18674 Transcript_15103/m.18674 type:complete len:109 (+) Transcript_15103:648-974(+)